MTNYVAFLWVADQPDLDHTASLMVDESVGVDVWWNDDRRNPNYSGEKKAIPIPLFYLSLSMEDTVYCVR
jgi:hypothetical protein